MPSNIPDLPESMPTLPCEAIQQIPTSSYDAAGLEATAMNMYADKHPFMGFEQPQLAACPSQLTSPCHSVTSNNGCFMSVHEHPPVSLVVPTHVIDKATISMINDMLNKSAQLKKSLLVFEPESLNSCKMLSEFLS